MNFDEISLIASRPFVRKFVYAIIQNIMAKNFDYEERHIIHTEMVPRTSEKVIQASLKEKTIPRVGVVPTIPPIVVHRPNINTLTAPITKSSMMPNNNSLRPQMQTPTFTKQTPLISVPKENDLSQDYGKITPLLNDPSISTIECQGEGKPLIVIRAGQKQGTRIILTAKEIKEILNKVSDIVHIPLLEGVFRAAVNNFSINAVISEIIGSRFIIKKQTAYALLER